MKLNAMLPVAEWVYRREQCNRAVSDIVFFVCIGLTIAAFLVAQLAVPVGRMPTQRLI
jgi:hypothetical protein